MAASAIMTPFRVGLVVICSLIAFFILMSFIAKQQYGEDDSYRVYADFKDATGLGPKSRVQIAGIEVGIVERIELTPEAMARAHLLIKKDIVLREDARIIKRSASLLGDFLLDVFPGSGDKPPIPDGGEIAFVIAQSGVDDVFAALGEVTRDIQAVTGSLKELVASDEVGSIKDIIRSMNEVALGLNKTIGQAGGRLDNILADVEVLSGNVRRLASGQVGNVQEILDNVRVFTAQANRLIDTVQGIVGSGEDELKSSVASVKDTLDRLQQTLESTQTLVQNADATITSGRNVMEGIERGEGTVGKLLRDDAIAQKVDSLLADVDSLTGPLARLQTHVHLREEVHFRPGARSPSGKASIDIKLVPGDSKKFYGIGFVSEPRGHAEREIIQVRDANGELSAPIEQIITTNESMKFNAYLGRRMGPAALRVGMLESSGGFGADLFALDEKVRLTVDAFDWANPDQRFPRVRASAQFTFLDHLYLGAGVDDFLNSTSAAKVNRPDTGTIQSGLDFFVTGGLEFNDEDLKSLLTIVGMPSP